MQCLLRPVSEHLPAHGIRPLGHIRYRDYLLWGWYLVLGIRVRLWMASTSWYIRQHNWFLDTHILRGCWAICNLDVCSSAAMPDVSHTQHMLPLCMGKGAAVVATTPSRNLQQRAINPPWSNARSA